MIVKYLHKPWEAPGKVLTEAGVKLGKDYPLPITNLRDSRDRALEAFSGLRELTKECRALSLAKQLTLNQGTDHFHLFSRLGM